MLPLDAIKKFPGSFWLLVLLANAGLLLAYAPYGIGLSVDSANYVSAARSLRNGHGLMMFDGNLLVNAPPLYSVLLSLTGLLFTNMLQGAAFLNLALLNATFFLALQILQRVGIKLSVWIIFLALLPYWAFEHAFAMALSEPLFICLFLFTVAALPDSKSENVFLLGLIPAALCMTRYAGFLMIPGFVSIMLFRGNAYTTMVKYLTPLFVVSVGWIWRNLSVEEGSALGAHTLIEKYNLYFMLVFIMGWVLLTRVLSKHSSSFSTPYGQVMLILLLPVLSYLLLLSGQIGLPLTQLPRFLSVVEFPLLMALAIFLSVRTENGRVWYLMVVLLVLLKSGLYMHKSLHLYSLGAGGFHSREWQNQPLLAALRELPSARYCSNFPDIVYWVRTEPCLYLPFTGESCKDFRERASDAQAVIWFNNTGRNHVMHAEPLLEQCFTISWETRNPTFSLGKLRFQ